jgi:D-glycero-D-manno-heptose 1,7-bisphosphate phosphatase
LSDAPATRRQAAFLDRDGVINRPLVREGRPYPPHSVGDLELYPDAEESLHRLRAAGFAVVVVTNQPDVARGTMSREEVHAIHREMCRLVPVDAVYVCFHDDQERCQCRKPAPGLLLDAATDMEIDLAHSFMVGDRWRDVEAGRRAGCRTVHIDRHYLERLPEGADWVTLSLAAAVDRIEDATAVRGAGSG